MKQNLGLALIVLGTAMLLISYFTKNDLVDCNWWNILSLLLIIGGIVAHIAITKRS